MPPNETVELEVQMERAEWVRRLARALVADEHQAEDVAQDAWVVALTGGPSRAEAWKDWIAGVLRNVLRARRRGERRREERERSAARGEELPTDDDLLDRLEVHERLVAAVRALDQPYRTTILLRYFEGLAPPEIAERTNSPLRTVHTRLHRGLARLRAELDRRHGARGTWLGLLVPLARPRDIAVAGAFAVSVKTKIAIAAAVVLGALLMLRGSFTSAPMAELAGSDAELAQPAAVVAPEETGASVRVAAGDDRPSPELAGAAAATALSLRGSVVDTAGVSVAGVRVTLNSEGSRIAEALTDARGNFEIGGEGHPRSLDVVHPSWTVVLRPRLMFVEGAQHVIVVAPRRHLAGVAVDESGLPLGNVSVGLALPIDLRASIQRVLDQCVDENWSARTDAAGAFYIEIAPDLAGCALFGSRQGFDAARVELEPGDRLDLKLVLKHHSTSPQHVLGRVVDARGAPIAGAFVAFAGEHAPQAETEDSTATNERGEFDLKTTTPFAGARTIRAVKAGSLPAELASRWIESERREVWPEPLELVLDGTPLSISGVVVDADGKPVADTVVTNLDTSRFASVATDFDGTQMMMSEDIETVLAGVQYSTAVATEADGRFEMRGLLAKNYRLRVFDRATLEVIVTAPIAAGSSGVEIRLPRGDRIARIAGRVIGASGAPARNVQVWLTRRGPAPNENSARSYDSELDGRGVTTDDEGRFEFRDMARGVTEICARPAGERERTSLSISAVADLEQIELVVVRSCHFKLDLSNSALAVRSIAVLDARGEMLRLTAFRGNVGSVGTRRSVSESGLESVSVAESGVTMVLFGASDVELARIPLKLVPGELVIVRP